ncbi:restriction endonuclease subunit S [Ornithinimicrobium ciconiae]|uniref:Restriction endonuclease subunit S n=1 Tax=Ornithinimicrobium ciconiae TaxID=2594265 RepID=A0A516GDE4_9MICO|nr:restriction endonuclease subunit S [Ornithinimicrobium ciconiae]QDO89545.1 restriction endonuclease subunit S [Ornithinimicrobium ciconiae]
MTTTIGKLAEAGVLNFGDGYRTKRSEHGQPGFRILRVADVTEGTISLDGQDFVAEQWVGQVGQKLSQEGDVLVTTKGTVGRVAIMPELEQRLVYSPQLCYFRVNRHEVLDRRWLSYWFRSPSFIEQASHRANNTDMAAYINLADIRSLVLPTTPIAAQRAIAEVLGALDDKIAANAALVTAAEALMKALAGSAPDRAPLAQLGVQTTAQLQPHEFSDRVAHFSLPAFDESASPEVTAGGSIKSNKFHLSEPTVLVSKLNPRIPRAWNVPVVPPEMALASTEFVVLAPQGLDVSELWAAVAQPEVWMTLQGKVAGTSGSHQRVRPAEVMTLSVKDVRELPSSARASLRMLGLRVFNARHESKSLAATRDALLPGLMSGKIRVKDAESVVEEVV